MASDDGKKNKPSASNFDLRAVIRRSEIGFDGLIARINQKRAEINEIKEKKRIDFEKKMAIKVRKQDVVKVFERADVVRNIMIFGMLAFQVFLTSIQQQIMSCENRWLFLGIIVLTLAGIFVFVWIILLRMRDISNNFKNLGFFRNQEAGRTRTTGVNLSGLYSVLGHVVSTRNTVWLYYQLPTIVFGVIELAYVIVLITITFVSCRK